MKLGISDWAKKLLILMLLTDAVFVLIHIIFLPSDFLGNKFLSIEADRSYAEIFQHVKEYWIGLIFAFLAIKNRSRLYFGWCLLFTYLLLDDSLNIHERLGLFLSQKVTFTLFSFRARDFGELAVSAVAGLVLFGIIAGAYQKANALERKTSKRLIVMILALTLCGVLIDPIHAAVVAPSTQSVLGWVLGILEDGGEMLVMSVITSFVFNLVDAEQMTEKQFGVAQEGMGVRKNQHRS